MAWSYLEEGQEYDRLLYPDECYTELEQSWLADDELGMADIETMMGCKKHRAFSFGTIVRLKRSSGQPDSASIWRRRKCF